MLGITKTLTFVPFNFSNMVKNITTTNISILGPLTQSKNFEGDKSILPQGPNLTNGCNLVSLTLPQVESLTVQFKSVSTAFLEVNDQKLIVGIFIFSCIVEFAQYFKIADKLGFQPGSLMYIVVGNSFSWVDILCYGVGCLLLFILVKTTKSA